MVGCVNWRKKITKIEICHLNWDKLKRKMCYLNWNRESNEK